jgi:hypothetical protein
VSIGGFLFVCSQLADESSIKTEAMEIDSRNSDELIEPSAKRTRYDLALLLSTNTDAQMKSFKNLFQSTASYHQAAGFVASLLWQEYLELIASV